MRKLHRIITSLLPRVVTLLTLAAIAAPWPALAGPGGPGHTHGDEAPIAAGELAPRTEAHSELFEFVGTFQDGEGGHALLIHLDRFATNEPVEGAVVEVDSGGQPATAEPQPDGTYLLRAPWLDRSGPHDLIISVTTGDDADLLTATLTLPDATPAAAMAATDPRSQLQAALGDRRGPVVAVLGFLLGAATVLLFQSRGRWRVAAGSVAVVAGVLVAGAALAHEGHDHGEAPAAAGDGPRRLPDGTVFLPKGAQRLLAIRTVVTAEVQAGRLVQAAGQVMADPNAFGRVQASQAGRIEIPSEAGGLAHVGQRVERGDVLAVIAPAIGALERGTLQVQTAELDAAVRLAEQRYRRLSGLAGSVAAREIDDARLELEGARRRRAAAAPTLTGVEVLRAPVSGIISAANAQAGSLVEPSAVLFEVVDPARLWIEAMTYDPAAAEKLRTASAVTSAGTPLKLEFIGSALTLQQGATPLQFRILDAPPNLAVGAPVNVVLETGTAGERGVVLPRAAVIRQSNGTQTVWDHTTAERFVARPVRMQPLDGARVLVLSGVTPGARIVTQGAELLGQVR